MVSLVATSTRPAASRKAVGIWLLAIAGLIAVMVTVGGLTRLTGSGLSITEWHPVTGAVPPLNADAWAREFAKYREIPQYKFENPHMTLADFKQIYWWEWSHRLLGRLLGGAFLLPLLAFAALGVVTRKDLPRLLALFLLGGLQGFVGWWMVESGLETRISVSQYRLAIHLGVALILLIAMIWSALEYLGSPIVLQRAQEGASKVIAQRAKGRRLAVYALCFVILMYLQMLLGALVAGLHAGLIYNTWPSMDGRALPEHPFFYAPWWRNFGDNAGLAQFDHRVGAYIVALSAAALWWRGRRLGLTGAARASGNAVLAVTAFQILLGIVTLLNQAPTPLAALHQATAVALLSVAIWHAFELRRAYAAASA